MHANLCNNCNYFSTIYDYYFFFAILAILLIKPPCQKVYTFFCHISLAVKISTGDIINNVFFYKKSVFILHLFSFYYEKQTATQGNWNWKRPVMTNIDSVIDFTLTD